VNYAGRSASSNVDIVVVGAGFAGLYMLHRALRQGRSAIAFERGEDVGGTWYWNRYPGARCDVESTQYSYSFSPELEQEWNWSERFAAQPEIQTYAAHVADRFGLRPHIRFGRTVTRAVFDEMARNWIIETDTRECVRARFCIMATGNLSRVKLPEIQGIEDFAGATFHTGAWPEEPVDFSGKRIGVIGTGSSGIQVIPEIARSAAALVVFQRTPAFSVPACNRPLVPSELAEVKRNYRELRRLAHRSRSGTVLPRSAGRSALDFSEEERLRAFEERWKGDKGGGASFLATFGDLLVSEKANETAAAFVRHKIMETVRDQQTAADLSPRNYPIGSKRLPCDTSYFETYNKDNVELVNLQRTPIVAVGPRGIRTSERQYDLDCLVFATGYDAGTGAINAIDIRGRDGVRLSDVWRDGPQTYLGLMVAGFPNLFTVTGPGSPSILTNLLVSIEYHVDWIARCIDDLDRGEMATIEASKQAQDEWVRHVADLAGETLFLKADSWYVGANVPGKPRVFMAYVGGVPAYEARCEEIAARGYWGFVKEGARVSKAGSTVQSA